jgi:hypothetical protein
MCREPRRRFELRIQNTDDGEGLVRNEHGASNDRRIGSKVIAPGVVSQHQRRSPVPAASSSATNPLPSCIVTPRTSKTFADPQLALREISATPPARSVPGKSVHVPRAP